MGLKDAISYNLYSWKCPKCGTRPKKITPEGDNKISFKCARKKCSVDKVTVEF